ncbi:hypothetical protein [Clostridium botulinum]|uniref:hypothetical protein n=1 Tax=Clostridium botulinum TaxID=1491 RepID=UPI001E3C4790|nr:hypothetical protein [Clostridium botulinum]MCD3223960.1 hypothetical protein [Clostridium botulinum C/D]MCD3298247.1 hypothetical protein [Clostridium botulinum C/D]
MNKLDFNNKEFKEAILNNIEDKENLDYELLDSIIKYEADKLAERVAHAYDIEIEEQNRIEYLKEYYIKHMVDKEDYDYLYLNNENKILVRIDNVEECDYKGKIYNYDYLIYVDSTNVYGWENLFIKRSNVDEDFTEIEIDDRTCELLDYYMFNENNN